MTDNTITFSPGVAALQPATQTLTQLSDGKEPGAAVTDNHRDMKVVIEDGPDLKLRLTEIKNAANPLLTAARPLLCALACPVNWTPDL